MHWTRLVALAFAATAWACSSDNTTPSLQSSSPDSGSEHTDTGENADAGMNESIDAGETESLLAPTLDMVMPMTGGLHVMWTNHQSDCDSIEGERKSDSEPYALAFSVPDGTVDNKHDAPLTAGAVYTYRLRCKKGATYSTYSNEMTATP